MSTNAPPFDPLNPTPEEAEDMLAGYLAAGPNGPGFRPYPVSYAYEHGWRCRRNDMAGVVDEDQRELARRLAGRHETGVEALARLAEADAEHMP